MECGGTHAARGASLAAVRRPGHPWWPVLLDAGDAPERARRVACLVGGPAAGPALAGAHDHRRIALPPARLRGSVLHRPDHRLAVSVGARAVGCGTVRRGVRLGDSAGSPFPYGPLAVIWWVPGPIVEFAAALAIMGILVWQRAIATLAVFALWQASVRPQWMGINDYSPGLLILIAMLVLRSRPLVGAIYLAAAAALKPYAIAWFLPAIGFGGGASPRDPGRSDGGAMEPPAWWGGPAAYVESVRIAGGCPPFSDAPEPGCWGGVDRVGRALGACWEWALLGAAGGAGLLLPPGLGAPPPPRAGGAGGGGGGAGPPGGRRGGGGGGCPRGSPGAGPRGGWHPLSFSHGSWVP